MLLVENCIGDLLVQHNCVVVPNFGGFVAQRVSSQMDTKNGILLPPRKSVLFNRQLINNDGLLAAAYAQNNKVSYEDAQHSIAETIENWGKALKEGKRISIDRVGILFADQERNICFEQDRFYNLLLSSFGMSSIHFISVADVAAKEANEVVLNLVKQTEQSDNQDAGSVVEFTHERIVPVVELVEEQPIAPIIPLHSKPVLWKYMAAVVLLPVAFYSFWIPMKTDVLESGVLSLNDFNPFKGKQIALYQAPQKRYAYTEKNQKKQLETIPENASFFSYEISDDHYVPVRISENNSTSNTPETVILPEETASKPLVVSTPKPTSQSHIIVGSFSSRENATNLCSMLISKGFKASVLESDNKIRVSAGNAKEFNQIAPQLRAEGLAPWVLN